MIRDTVSPSASQRCRKSRRACRALLTIPKKMGRLRRTRNAAALAISEGLYSTSSSLTIYLDLSLGLFSSGRFTEPPTAVAHDREQPRSSSCLNIDMPFSTSSRQKDDAARLTFMRGQFAFIQFDFVHLTAAVATDEAHVRRRDNLRDVHHRRSPFRSRWSPSGAFSSNCSAGRSLLLVSMSMRVAGFRRGLP
jgi:hypothetical protein